MSYLKKCNNNKENGVSWIIYILKAIEETSRYTISKIEENNEFYRSEDVILKNGETTLAGTLTVPKKEGKHPAVVLISGSGPQNRDSDVFSFKIFAYNKLFY
ncbi:MAG: hypothetical protein HC831_17710 [Chloroflexia bacterium]|nr:hypothetical protein [Chloroflexia bacterium]